MVTLRRGVWIVALSAACGLGLAASRRAADITSPAGGFTVGIFTIPANATGNISLGTLYDTPTTNTLSGIGFQRSDGYDPILGPKDGFPRKYWGITAGSFHGYADPAGKNGGPGETGNISMNLAPNGPLTVGPGGHSATNSTVLNNGVIGNNVVRIDQTFTFSKTNNVLDIHITLTNLTNTLLSNVQYRRGIDFDVAPFSSGTVNETVIVPPLAPPVTATTTQDLDNADPLFAYKNQPAQGDFAGGLTINLGSLFASGDSLGRDSTSFDVFEGISQLNEGPGGLLSDMNAAGANFVIEGVGPGGTNSAAIGVLVSTVPEPATVSLLGLGLAGLAGWRRWRRRPA